MLEYRFDVQLLIDGEDLNEDEIHDAILANIPGDFLSPASPGRGLKHQFAV